MIIPQNGCSATIKSRGVVAPYLPELMAVESFDDIVFAAISAMLGDKALSVININTVNSWPVLDGDHFPDAVGSH